MTESTRTLRVIQYALLGAVLASLVVLMIAGAILGFHFNWPEWQGRLVGLVATVLGVAAATFGARIALRAQASKED